MLVDLQRIAVTVVASVSGNSIISLKFSFLIPVECHKLYTEFINTKMKMIAISATL